MRSQNLIKNGGFEESTTTGNFKTFQIGEEFTGWKVIQATVDLNNSKAFSHSGRNSVDLNGTPGVGGIEQRFATKKGKKYKLSFYLSANNAGFPDIKKMRVNVGNQKAFYSFDQRGKTTENMGWELNELVFKATGNETLLQFYSTEGHENPYWGPLIDDIIVEPLSGKNSLKKESNSFFEFNYGLLGGMSYYFIDRNDLLELYANGIKIYNINIEEAGYGYHFGFHTQFRAGPIFIRPDIMLNTNSLTYRVDDARIGNTTIAEERYLYLDVPVMLGFKYKVMSVFAGPAGHVFLYNQSKLNTGIPEINTEFERFSLNYQAGLGLDLSILSLDLRYEGNLTQLGDGIVFEGQKIYFSKSPSRILATLTFRIN